MNIQIDWVSVLENAIGNGISDLIIGAFVVIVVTRFFEKLSYKKDSIGTLVLIDAEIKFNNHILENVLNELIPSFEKHMRRSKTDKLPLDQPEFENAAKFMRIPIDSLLSSAFTSSYSRLGNLENTQLLEKILNIYTVSYHYTIQTSFRMEQLDWSLLDQIKEMLKREITKSNGVAGEIRKEVEKLRKRRTLFEALRVWEILQ